MDRYSISVFKINAISFETFISSLNGFAWISTIHFASRRTQRYYKKNILTSSARGISGFQLAASLSECKWSDLEFSFRPNIFVVRLKIMFLLMIFRYNFTLEVKLRDKSSRASMLYTVTEDEVPSLEILTKLDGSKVSTAKPLVATALVSGTTY